jgi:hypothetical protein
MKMIKNLPFYMVFLATSLLFPFFILQTIQAQTVTVTFNNNFSNPSWGGAVSSGTNPVNNYNYSATLPNGATNITGQAYGGGGGGGSVTYVFGGHAGSGGGGGYIRYNFGNGNGIVSGQVGGSGTRGEAQPDRTDGKSGGESNLTFGGSTIRAYGGGGGTSRGTAGTQNAGSGGTTSANAGASWYNGSAGLSGGTGTEGAGGRNNGPEGGAGGPARDNSGVGYNGYYPGGGGASAYGISNHPGGHGAGGKVIISFDLPSATFFFSNNVICQNETTKITINNPLPGVTYRVYRETTLITTLASAPYEYTTVPEITAGAIPFRVDAVYTISVTQGTGVITANSGASVNGNQVTVTGTSQNLTVNPLPVVSLPDNKLCIGSEITLSPTTGGTWLSNAPSVASITNAGLVTGLTAGSATFTFTNSTTGCSATTSAVTINHIPVFNLSSTSAGICTGESLDLSGLVSSVANGVVHYYSDEACQIPTTSTVTASGTYYLRAENITTGCKSAAQAVNVSLKTATGISVDPAGGSTCAGTDITMTVTAIGQGTLSYQWKKDGTTNVGTNSANYATSVPGSYTVTVTGECGSVTSSAAVITNKPATTVTMHPDPETVVCAGTPVNLSVTATGESTLTYQWYKTGDIPIEGAENSTYSPTASGIYYVKVTGGCGNPVTSNESEVTINPLPVPTFTTGAISAAKDQAGMVYRTQAGMSNYDWEITGGNITSGGDGYNEATVTWGDGTEGTITVTYMSPAGCLAIIPASRTVTLNNQNLPTISGDFTICPTTGNTYTYTTESGKFNYNWTVSGGNVVGGSITSNTVTVEWDNTTSGGNISVSYRHQNNAGLPLVNANGNITKQTVTSITTHPQGNTVCSGGTVLLSVEVSYAGTAHYQWKKNGTNVGTDSENHTATETGSYTVEVSATCGSATSDAAVVEVKDQPVASLSGTDGVVTTQQETYTAGAGSNYNWNYTGATLISGGTSSDNTITLQWEATGSGSVSVNYTDNGCPTATKTIDVTISAQGTPTLVSPVTSVCYNTSQNYNTQTGKFNYLWTVTGGNVSTGQGTENVTINWGSASTGTIKVKYSESGTSEPVESPTTNITINNKPSIAAIVDPAGVCDNTHLTLNTPEVASVPSATSQSWKWEDGSSFISGGIVSYSQNGQRLYYEAVNICGSTQSNFVTISVYPTPVSGTVSDITLCADSPQGAITPTGGSNVTYYTWNGGAPAGLADSGVAGNTTIPGFTASGVTNRTIANVSLTPYFVNGSKTCNGTPVNFDITVNPLPEPTINGSFTVAKGRAGVVYTTESGMNNYTWNISGGTITSATNTNSVTVTWDVGDNGIISVSYDSPEGCSASGPVEQTIILIDQNVSNITGITTVCPKEGNSYTYTTESGKFDYNWVINGGNVVGGNINTNTVTVEWDNDNTNGSISVSYRHENDPGLPPVDANKLITKQQVTTITSAPMGAVVCFNNEHTMTVIADSQHTPTYQWQKNGTNVGSNSASYTATESGSYTVTVSAICGSATSNPVTVMVKEQPEATISGPATVYVTEEVTYTAGPGSSYNWTYTGAGLVSGGSNDEITLQWNTTGAKSFRVDYIVDGCPTTTAIQNVTVRAQGTPTILSPVTDVCRNKPQSYSTQTDKFNYLWTVTGGTIKDGIANESTVIIIWDTEGTGTLKVAYSEVLKATAVESEETNITIHGVPVISAISAPAGVCDNTPLSLASPAASSGTSFPVTAEGWKLNGNAFASGDIVTYSQHNQPLYYEAINACGTNQSNTVNITVYELPTVTTIEQNICPGTGVNLTNTVTNPEGYTLGFYTRETGGTALESPTVNPEATITYYVEAINNNGCVIASRVPVAIIVKAETRITVQPTAPPIVGIGNPFSLNVTATGTNQTYQWYKDNTPIPGAQSDTYAVTAATTADYGEYYVVVDGDCGSPQTSTTVIINVLSPDATLKNLLVNGITVPGFDPQITEYTYYVACEVEQADVIGITNHPNATVDNRTGYPLEPGDNRLSIEVTAENGFIQKSYNINIVRDCYAPRILKNLEDAIVCIGESHTFEIIAEGEDLTYEWYYGNSRIWGANSNTYTISNSELRDYERYYVIVRNNYMGYKASTYSRNVRLWVADYLPETLNFLDYPNPAITGKTYLVKLAGYPDVTKYGWSYRKTGSYGENDGVTFSPAEGGIGENETWATFGTLSEGIGTITATMEHPCGTREATQTITVKYPMGTGNVNATIVQVSPNPTSGIVKVSNTRANQQIRIMDTTGSLKGIYPTQEGTTTIDLTGYAKGAYLLQYDSKTFKVIRK